MNTQDEPVEAGSTAASTEEKIAGIVQQTRQDAAIGSIAVDDVADVLWQRLSDAGIPLDASTFDRLVEAASP